MVHRVVFVCLGNICRSPTAEGVFRKLAADLGVDVATDGAGTSDWHIGDPPDERAQAAAAARGYDLSEMEARQFIAADFEAFDRIIAMDEDNRLNIERLRPAGSTTPVELLLDYAPDQPLREVPDPYYTHGFDSVLDLIEDASRGLIASLKS